jgi:hypothetical protein
MLSKRVKIALRILIVLLLLSFFVVTGVLFGYNYVIAQEKRFEVLEASIADGSFVIDKDTEGAVPLVIKQGDMTSDIADNLFELGLIDNTLVFSLMSKINGFDGAYMAGTHYLIPGLTYDEIMYLLTQKAESVYVTFPEGITYEEIKARLHEAGLTFDDAEMDQCMDYLIRHPVMPTPLTKFLAYAVFGDKLGGGRGIDVLDRRVYTRLICLLQMIVFHLGLKELGHMLTANRTDTVRLMKTPEETKFELNYGTGFAYRACNDRFASMSRASDGKEWDRQMHDICEDIVNHKYTYNTPLFIMDQLGDSAPVNGEVIPVEIEIISEACSVITMFCGHSV